MFSTTQLSTSCLNLKHDRPAGRALEGMLLAHSLAEVHYESVRKNVLHFQAPLGCPEPLLRIVK